MKTHNKNNFAVTDNEHLECDKCSKEFKTKSGLKLHVESVHKGLRFPCEICKKEFCSKYEVVRHQRNIHSKQIL